MFGTKKTVQKGQKSTKRKGYTLFFQLKSDCFFHFLQSLSSFSWILTKNRCTLHFLEKSVFFQKNRFLWKNRFFLEKLQGMAKKRRFSHLFLNSFRISESQKRGSKSDSSGQNNKQQKSKKRSYLSTLLNHFPGFSVQQSRLKYFFLIF